jgi:adenylate kinase
VTYNPPPAEVADRVQQRKDDTLETCTERLDKYHRETEPIIPFYEGLGILKRVDGVGSLDEVSQRLLTALR